MLTPEQIEENKKVFSNLIGELAKKRPDENWQELFNYLNNSDFFYAPASTIFHAAYDGGLCEHSLNVYHALIDLLKVDYPDKVETDEEGNAKTVHTCPWKWDTIAIVSLLHDISKTDFYIKDFKNKKIYDAPTDKAIDMRVYKKDSQGYYRWDSVPEWRKRPICDAFKYGNHEETSVLLLQKYIWLTDDEIIAILHHTGSVHDNFDESKQFSYVYSSHKLAAYLHMADFKSSFIIEESALLNE